MRCVAAGLVVAASSPGFAAGTAGPREMFASKWHSVKEAFQRGDWDAYATGYAWHLPYGYSSQVRGRLNETTWGGGVGRSFYDEDGDRHSVFLMGFADSHRDLQVNAGYGWQRFWNVSRDLGVGGGYLAFLFSRRDVANHLPIPALLPCASVRWRRTEIIGLFVPRVSRDIKGDVFFVYLRVPLGSEPSLMKRSGANADGHRRR